MLKKILLLTLIFFIFFTNLIILADDEIDIEEINNIDEIINTAANIEDVPSINSKYAVVIDRNTNCVLYGKKENEQAKMASTTKIMTAIIVLENANLNDIVNVSSKAASTGGSKLKFNKGDQISVKDLLYGLMLRSGNDAAVALAEYIGGDIEKFAKMMNGKAKEIGLLNTNFESPHGLDSDKHYTTAYELAILTNYALQNEVFRKIVGTQNCNITINGVQRNISNTNELLGNLNGVYGVKTGFTNGAGRCLVTSVKRGDLDIICVVLGADTKKSRTTDSVKLIEYTFKNFEYINIKEKIEEEFENWLNINSKRICINKGIKNSINLKLDEYNLEKYPIKKGTKDSIQIKIECNFNLAAPIEKGKQIGMVTCFYNDNIILEIPILTDEYIAKKEIHDYMLEFVKNYNLYFKNVL